MNTIRNGIEKAMGDSAAMFERLSDGQLGWSPAPGTWSIVRNLEHLSTTARRMMEAMDAACANGPKSGPNSQPWKPSIFARWFLRILEPPAKMKVKTTAPFDPAPGRAAGSAIAEFREIHAALLAKLDHYASYDQNMVRVVSPFQSKLKYKLGTALAILPAHMRRHNHQMRQLKELSAFPKS